VTVQVAPLYVSALPCSWHWFEDQESTAEPGSAVAVSVTVVPCAYVALQFAVHEIPGGELVTLPVPSPPKKSVNVWSTAGAR
jgi:hypothetical protein